MSHFTKYNAAFFTERWPTIGDIGRRPVVAVRPTLLRRRPVWSTIMPMVLQRSVGREHPGAARVFLA
jgi:hypothetical protein